MTQRAPDIDFSSCFNERHVPSNGSNAEVCYPQDPAIHFLYLIGSIEAMVLLNLVASCLIVRHNLECWRAECA